MFKEVASGAKSDRAQLRRVLKVLEAGDVLLVTRLDRLTRSTRDLLNTLATIAGKKAAFRSACDTGLGDLQDGEGLFGLRRAFVIAGAQRLVMSLWKIDDWQTQKLMVAFYSELIAGTAAVDALRQAQSCTRQGAFSDPCYWAAFVLQGEPGCLR